MTSITRRSFGLLSAASGAAAAGGAAAVGGARAARATTADHVNVGIMALASHAPTMIAQAKGYFTGQGLAVKFVSFQAAQAMAVAIASGDVDFGITAITGGLISLADKNAVRVIGGALQEAPDVAGEKILVSKKAFDAGITTPAKLKGRSFGITTAGSSFQYMAHKIAQKEGFSDSNLRMMPLENIPTLVAALRSGEIDAWSIVPDIADSLVSTGDVHEIGKISDYIPNYQVTTVFTSKANVTKRTDLVKRFLAGFGKGVDDYNAALVYKKMSPQDTAGIIEIIHQYVYTTLPTDQATQRISAGAMLISPNARMNLQNIEDQLSWFKSGRMVPPNSSMAELVDTSFVQTY
jgi:NitT/TauT family transport system substrate-binding protein